ncbi:MAG: Asp-tRNA(Asn)/Glu-tRNA(Gln) amidotransferase GatCAB subunit B, partial [Alphaproteobacteria bacterium]|nr:Asp-tRNA(Asn)/Glu-tRNA(Gln) amidotransferase GatCAB subunit B [Alphaproteobacteria bacterium]
MTYILKGKNKEYEMNIGLEIHCQVISDSKLFSKSSTKFGALPNTHVSFLDSGFPGQLPVINKFCIEQAIKTGLGLNAKINKKSVFDRKHYFYADLPTGYQITQQFHPIVSDGWVEIINEEGVSKKIRIEKLHVEQDAGKLTHDLSPTKSMVD